MEKKPLAEDNKYIITSYSTTFLISKGAYEPEIGTSATYVGMSPKNRAKKTMKVRAKQENDVTPLYGAEPVR